MRPESGAKLHHFGDLSKLSAGKMHIYAQEHIKMRILRSEGDENAARGARSVSLIDCSLQRYGEIDAVG